jgi:hypothetical protein
MVHADNARTHTAKVTRAFCDGNFLRIAPDSSSPSDLAPSEYSSFSFGHVKTASKDVSNLGLQMNFFQESEKVGTKSALTFWQRFSGIGLTDWTDALQHRSKWKVLGMK